MNIKYVYPNLPQFWENLLTISKFNNRYAFLTIDRIEYLGGFIELEFSPMQC